jgi:putative transposase
MNRKAYPSDVSDEEWALVAPCLTLMREDAPQREYELREMFNGLRYVIKTGATWRMMRRHGIQARRRRRYRVTTQSQHDHPVAPNLLKRKFTAERPNQVWLTNITYVPTAEGWLYLAAVLDLFSRRIVGWTMGSRLKTELVKDAFQMALDRRQPSFFTTRTGAVSMPAQTINHPGPTHHQVSMSGAGNCYDNAPMESFFSSLKSERVHPCRYLSRTEARHDLFAFIEVFYNRQRRHSSLGYLSPAAFEQHPFVLTSTPPN